jgi:spermidine/putrescine-binding protein
LITEAINEFFIDPFEAETGASVTSVEAPDPNAAALLQIESGQVQWDVIDATSVELMVEQDALERIPDDLKALAADFVADPSFVTDYGISGYGDTATLIACNPDVVSRCPTSISEYWDVESFPGPRAMEASSPYAPITFALIADGATGSELDEPDLDRAFAKLREIKDEITVYTSSGDQQQQTLRDQQVGIATLWNGRAVNLREDMPKLELAWDDCLVGHGTMEVVKGAPHPETAFAYMGWWIQQAQAQADWTKRMSYPTPNKDVIGLLPADLAEAMPVSHDCVNQGPSLLWFSKNNAAVQEAWQEFLAGG